MYLGIGELLLFVPEAVRVLHVVGANVPELGPLGLPLEQRPARRVENNEEVVAHFSGAADHLPRQPQHAALVFGGVGRGRDLLEGLEALGRRPQAERRQQALAVGGHALAHQLAQQKEFVGESVLRLQHFVLQLHQHFFLLGRRVVFVLDVLLHLVVALVQPPYYLLQHLAAQKRTSPKLQQNQF